MSFPMDHQESIYAIIPEKKAPVVKPPRHVSKHSGMVPPTASTFHTKGTTVPALSNLEGLAQEKIVGDYSFRTIGGAPGSARNDPDSFMRSGAKTARVPLLAEVKRTHPELLKPTVCSARLKPTVPRSTERPLFNMMTSKNFVVANAVDTILAAPKRTQDVAKDYLHKEDYGKTPKYLEHIKRDIEHEYAYIDQLQKQSQEYQIANHKPQPLPEEDRLQLIGGLKAKWEQVNTAYQATTHLTKLDTIGKLKRKEKYETQLAQIEKDIAKLNRRNLLVDAGF